MPMVQQRTTVAVAPGGGSQEFAREPQTTASPDGTDGAAEPFIRNAREHTEFAFDTGALAWGAFQVNVTPQDIPAIGFLRQVFLDVNATGGVGGGNTVAAQPDAPYSAIASIQLLDISGQANVDLDGYSLFLVNLFGGYFWSPSLSTWPKFTNVVTGAGASGNYRFQLYVPVELMADGYCALPNENAAATLKLRLIVDSNANVYTVAPATTQPTVDVRADEDVWTRPLVGTQEPPAVGSTAYWRRQSYALPAGTSFTTIRDVQVGNWVHTKILVWRSSAGARYDISGITDFRIRVDGVDLVGPTTMLKLLTDTFIDYGFSAPTGVYPYSRRTDLDGHPAKDDTAELWLPTTAATRLEYAFTVPTGQAAGGTLTVITGDIIPVGGIPYPFQPPL